MVLAASIYCLLSAQSPPPAPPDSARPIGKPLKIGIPLGLPPFDVPADNPPTAETVRLGKLLFYEPRLSADESISCSSCHDPRYGFADRRPVSLGVGGQAGGRNAPPIANVAYLPATFWDGRAATLEKQAEQPVLNPIEMAHTLGGVEDRLNADAAYRQLFQQAFGPGPVTYEKVAKALASFERMLLVGNSPFDRWYFGGDEHAMSEAARRGFEVFRDPTRGNCVACHLVDQKYALFTDRQFHNIGIGFSEGVQHDRGRYDITRNAADLGAFKTPSLRNVARTAPYMHDGSLRTLDEVLNFYSNGGNPNPNIDSKLHQARFGAGDREDLIEFLKSLTGDVPWEALPLDLPKTIQNSKFKVQN